MGGFEGDAPEPSRLREWYAPHVEAWSRRASPQTTLWLWNTELGWATLHPLLEEHGWRFVSLHVWDKGKAHVAGKGTARLRHLPVVTEVCAQYVREARVGGLGLRDWLAQEWKRAGLSKAQADQAVGVRTAASRKYLDRGPLWYPRLPRPSRTPTTSAWEPGAWRPPWETSRCYLY